MKRNAEQEATYRVDTVRDLVRLGNPSAAIGHVGALLIALAAWVEQQR